MNETNISLLAAAVSYYTMLSLFPALATLISAYGLIADPGVVQQQLQQARGLLPPEALALVNQEITLLLSQNNSTLGIGFVTGALLTLWSARSGAISLMISLNAVHRQLERRGLVMQQLVALAITLGGVMVMVLALTMVAIVPAIMAMLPFRDLLQTVLFALRWPLITVVIFASFAAIYRFAPCRADATPGGILAGAVTAAVIWIAGSALFSLYVLSFGSYDRVYGSIGAVVVMLIWLYVSAYSLLIGAAVDAELQPSEIAKAPPGDPVKPAPGNSPRSEYRSDP